MAPKLKSIYGSGWSPAKQATLMRTQLPEKYVSGYPYPPSTHFSALELPARYAPNSRQGELLDQYDRSFYTGNLKIYKESQKLWIRDTASSVKNMFRVVEPLSDTRRLCSFRRPIRKFRIEKVGGAVVQIHQTVSWTEVHLKDHGKRPVERTRIGRPDIPSLHALAYCSSIIFPGIYFPKYNDVRQEHVFQKRYHC